MPEHPGRPASGPSWPGGSADDLARWNEVARTYAEHTGDSGDSFWRRAEPYVEAAVGEPEGRRVLDVGCGHGWLSGLLAARGADVVGVDGSAQLIARARAGAPELDFRVHDLVQGLPAGVGQFDVALAHMVLMDLPELAPLLHDLRGALVAGAPFVATVLHPAFFHQTPTTEADGSYARHVTGYLEPERWWIESFGGHWHYHRPLETYVRELVDAGFVLTRAAEPASVPFPARPVEEWTEYERWFATIPTMLVLEARAA